MKRETWKQLPLFDGMTDAQMRALRPAELLDRLEKEMTKRGATQEEFDAVRRRLGALEKDGRRRRRRGGAR